MRIGCHNIQHAARAGQNQGLGTNATPQSQSLSVQMPRALRIPCEWLNITAEISQCQASRQQSVQATRRSCSSQSAQKIPIPHLVGSEATLQAHRSHSSAGNPPKGGPSDRKKLAHLDSANIYYNQVLHSGPGAQGMQRNTPKHIAGQHNCAPHISMSSFSVHMCSSEFD